MHSPAPAAPTLTVTLHPGCPAPQAGAGDAALLDASACRDALAQASSCQHATSSVTAALALVDWAWRGGHRVLVRLIVPSFASALRDPSTKQCTLAILERAHEARFFEGGAGQPVAVWREGAFEVPISALLEEDLRLPLAARREELAKATVFFNANGLHHHPVDLWSGRYSGRLGVQTDAFIAQNIGNRTVVLHDKALLGRELHAGQDLVVDYKSLALGAPFAEVSRAPRGSQSRF